VTLFGAVVAVRFCGGGKVGPDVEFFHHRSRLLVAPEEAANTTTMLPNNIKAKSIEESERKKVEVFDISLSFGL
jgi:hypothetical protein